MLRYLPPFNQNRKHALICSVLSDLWGLDGHFPWKNSSWTVGSGHIVSCRRFWLIQLTRYSSTTYRYSCGIYPYYSQYTYCLLWVLHVYWQGNMNCSWEFPQSSKCPREAQRWCPDILLIVVSTAALQHNGLVSSSVIGRMTCWNTTRMFCQLILWRMWRQRLCLSLSSWWWKWEVVLAMSMFFAGGCKRTWAAVHWAGLLQHKMCMLSSWPIPKRVFQYFAFRCSFAFTFKQFLFSGSCDLACDLDDLFCLPGWSAWGTARAGQYLTD